MIWRSPRLGGWPENIERKSINFSFCWKLKKKVQEIRRKKRFSTHGLLVLSIIREGQIENVRFKTSDWERQVDNFFDPHPPWQIIYFWAAVSASHKIWALHRSYLRVILPPNKWNKINQLTDRSCRLIWYNLVIFVNLVISVNLVVFVNFLLFNWIFWGHFHLLSSFRGWFLHWRLTLIRAEVRHFFIYHNQIASGWWRRRIIIIIIIVIIIFRTFTFRFILFHTISFALKRHALSPFLHKH